MISSKIDPSIVAISGGVGGSKLAMGLANSINPEKLMIVANIGDDFKTGKISLPIIFAYRESSPKEKKFGLTRGFQSTYCPAATVATNAAAAVATVGPARPVTAAVVQLAEMRRP